MACPRCGFALPTDAVRCPTCGIAADAHLRIPAEVYGAEAEPGSPLPGAHAPGPAVRDFAGRGLGGHQGAGSGPLRPIHGQAVGVIVALALWVVGELVACLTTVVRILVLNRLGSEGSSMEEDLEFAGGLDVLGALVRTVVLVIAAVAFLVWLFRARANAQGLSWVYQRHGKVSLVLGWIVPGVNFIVPKQIIDDIWLASRPGTPAQTWDGERRSWLVRSWWAGYLLSMYGIRFAQRAMELGTDGDPVVVVTWLEVIATPIGIAAAVLAAMVVWRISAFQELRRGVGAGG
ncbi:DUF4328 domain-containing protein [Sphaerisporangium sp. NPDC005289]|uniref:DUF4328 domain-containing protein n=1 Tax=Sphaerisporangium sp. NPDC005289 TaxID=3155247 RepID=UPI0033B4C24F